VQLEGPCDALRVMGDDGEVGAGWLVGGAAPLFPVAPGTEGDVIAGGKLLLRQGKGAAEGLGARHSCRYRALDRAIGTERSGLGDRGWASGSPRAGR